MKTILSHRLTFFGVGFLFGCSLTSFFLSTTFITTSECQPEHKKLKVQLHAGNESDANEHIESKDQLHAENESQSTERMEPTIQMPESKNDIYDFERLFSKTDKTFRHGYQWFYGPHLAEFRGKKNIAVLEIGGRTGDSAMAWSSYLGGEDKREEDNEHVSVDVITYGGKNDEYKFNNPTLECVTNCSVHTFYVDQSDAEKLEEVIGQRPGGWDIVIDDGSHVPFHNIISFETLWKNVRPGGIYIVEDIETSYYPNSEVYGYRFKAGILAPPPRNSLSRFRQYVDVINRGYIGPTGNSLSLFEGDHSIMEIGFARNLIFIRKVPEGNDLSGKTYSDYPDGMSKLRNFAQIEATLDIALSKFQKQTTLLGPSFNAKISSNNNAGSGMTNSILIYIFNILTVYLLST